MPRKPFVDEVKLGIFVLVVLTMLAYMSVKIGGAGVGETIKASGLFDDASGLVKDAAVSIAGVRVGTVRDLSIEGRRAKITFSIVPEAKVRNDVIVAIRAKSLLGEKYLEIIPQSDTAPLLKSGDALTRSIAPAELDQLTSKMKVILDALAPGEKQPGLLEDATALTKMLRASMAEVQATLPETLRNLRDLTEEMKTMAAQNREKLSQTLDSTNRLAQSSARLLEEHKKQIGRTVENADKITAAFAGQSQDIAKNLATISANIAAASAKFPELAESMSRVSAKLDRTLDMSLRLLALVEKTDYTYVMRKILEEEGITVNLFPKKIQKSEAPEEKNPPQEEPKQKVGEPRTNP